MTSKTLNLKWGILILPLLFFGVFSCKKEDVASDKKYSTGKSFQTDLQEKLIAYDKNHPILDSISAIGKIQWGKVMARYTISNRNPINFELPIVTDGVANSLLEFAFTFDFKLIDIKIRRLNLSSIEEKTNINNFESTRTGRMLYQFSKQGLKINKSLLRYRQEAERTQEKVAHSLLNLKAPSSTVMNNNIALRSRHITDINVKKSIVMSNFPGPPPSEPINLPGLGNFDGPVQCWSEFDFDFLFLYKQDDIALGQNYQQYLSERFYYNLYYRSGGILFNIPQAYSNKIYFFNSDLYPFQLGDLVWRVLYYCLDDVNQYMARTDFIYFYYSVSGTCGNQAEGSVYYGEGAVNPFPETNPPVIEIKDSVNNPCIKNALSLALAKNAVNEIKTFFYNSFGSSQDYNVVFADKSLNSNIDAKTSTKPDDNGIMTSTITFNTDVAGIRSEQYTVATIYHEMVHAELRKLFPESPLGVVLVPPQHDYMAQNFVDKIKTSLKSVFPNLSDTDAYALAWGGLKQTSFFDLLTDASKTFVGETLMKYSDKDRYDKLGTYCN